MRLRLCLNSLLHFLVDGVCACCLFQLLADITTVNTVAVVLTYDILAFMTQPLTGWLVDAMKQRQRMLIAAVAFLITATVTALIVGRWPFIIATLLGIGNSLFHVWGGRATTVSTRNDIRAHGVFVSTGALGLTSGIMFHSWWLLTVYAVLLCATAVLALRYDQNEEVEECIDPSTPLFKLESLTHQEILRPIAVAGIMLFVLFRAWIGERFTMDVDRTLPLVAAITCLVWIGKASGGWIALRLGLVTTICIVIAGIGVCWILHSSSTAAMLAGLFLLNTTMPVTLYLANVFLPRRPGLAFGLLAAVLVPGYLLAQL